MPRTRLAWLALALPLTACLNDADAKKVDAATQQVFAEMKAKEYDTMYDAAAPDMHAATTKQAFVSFLDQVDAVYGDCQTPVKAMNFRVNATTSGYFSSQGYTQQCATGQKQLEVTIVMRQGVAQLAGLHVAPANAPASNGT